MLLTLLGSRPAGAAGTMSFEVTDPRDRIESPIGGELIASAVRLGHGWEIEVVERSAGERPANLLYHSPAWRGPYPTQIMALHSGTRLFADVRVLPVRGYSCEVEITLRSQALQEALCALSDRDRRVLVLRYGLEDEDPKTLEEIGRCLGLTRERVRQIEVESLRRLAGLREMELAR